MKSKVLISKRQIDWARSKGLKPDIRGYLPQVDANLFAILSADTEKAFRVAGGNELTDGPDGRAKMRALHSSSALVCNVFEHWRTNPAAVSRAFAIPHTIAKIQFEAKLHTGLGGTPPTLDLLLVASEKLAWGVESKFTEPFQSKPKKNLFSSSYFKVAGGLWNSRGLPRCEALVRSLHAGQIAFFYLDAAQLLKHTLGIRSGYRDGN
jgi:hypothetical protein